MGSIIILDYHYSWLMGLNNSIFAKSEKNLQNFLKEMEIFLYLHQPKAIATKCFINPFVSFFCQIWLVHWTKSNIR